MKKVLIIGSSGYIGSRVSEYLINNSYEVSKVDNLQRPSALIDNSQNFFLKNYQELDSDFLNSHSDCIWLAGHSSVHDSITDPSGALKNNFFDLVKFREKFKNRLIYASSGSVYSRLSPEYCDEKSPTMIPSNVYDFTKITFDNYLISNKKEGIGLRFGTVNGKSSNMKKELMINSMVKSFKETGEIFISNKSFFRPILSIEDLIFAISKILESKINNGIYNLASFNTSIDDLSKQISSLTGAKIIDMGNSQTYNFMMKTQKFEKDFNFQFYGSVQNIVSSLLSFEY